MIRYTLRRLLATVPVIIIVAVIVFSILYTAPGDPAAIMAGDSASPEDIERTRQSLGLDQGFLVRFSLWAASVLRGDLGTSIYTRIPVTSLIGQRLLPTVSIVILTLLIAIAVAVPLGAFAATRHNTAGDRLAMVLSVVGFSVPSFIVSYILAFYFGLKLRWLPIQGFVPPSAGFGRYLSSLVLPSCALAFLYMALISRITRSAMLEVLGSDYVRTARAKGLSEWAVVFIHALRNASIPIATVIGIGFASLLGGAVIIETVFAIPGVGQLMVNSILYRDYPVIQGVLLLSSLSYVLINLGVDILYAALDPRIRY